MHLFCEDELQGGYSLCRDVSSCLVSLCLHDPLHVSGPAVLAGYQSAGRVGQPLRQDGLLDLKGSGALEQKGPPGSQCDHQQ